MTTRRDVLAFLASTAAGGGAALAQGDGGAMAPGQQQMQREADRAQWRSNNPRPGEHRTDGPQPGYAPGADPYRRWGRDERAPYAYGYRWRRGERLPYEYRSRSYVVDDWRGHRLRPPPPGHYWVQYGDEYLLVAIATGLITEVLLANR
jgi:Ni/Co efflux regulator RcnB